MLLNSHKFSRMKVHCPIPGCKWSHGIDVQNKSEEEIYAQAKAWIAHHRRNTTACMQFICACREPFQYERGLNQHIHKSRPRIRGQVNEHFQLSYVSIITRDNHKVLNVDSVHQDQPLRNFAAFDNAETVVYGSAIGRNNFTINPPPHASAEFTRAGTTVRQLPASRPFKKPRQFGSEETDVLDSTSFEDTNDIFCTFIPESTDETSSAVHSSVQSQSACSQTSARRANHVRLLSSSCDEIPIDSDQCLDMNQQSIPQTIDLDVPDNEPEREQVCRRSMRIIRQRQRTNANDNATADPITTSDDTEEIVHDIANPSIATAEDDPSVNQFFALHEDRPETDQPELNVNGVNGYVLEEEEDIDLGWGGGQL